MKYESLFARLVANTRCDNDTGCWIWQGRTRRHGGGERPAINMRIDGKHTTQNAARVMLAQFHDLDDGDEASHLCDVSWLCVCPDHLIPETKQANMARRWGRDVALPVLEARACDVDWLAGVACDPAHIPF